MERTTWKVGELARLTGITVRTLHHYDEIGLISPSHHSRSEHRLYDAADLARLQRILSLKQLGFSLEEIQGCLDRQEFSPQRVLRMHIDLLRDGIDLQRRLCDRLEAIAAALERSEDVSADEFMRTIEVMTMFEKYYTKEQLGELRERGRTLGPERIRAVENEWRELIAKVRAEMERGTDPASEVMKPLVKRWSELVREFTGGNPGIEASLRNVYREEPQAAAQFGMQLDAKLFEFVGKASAAQKKAQ